MKNDEVSHVDYQELTRDLEQALAEIPVLDVHTHLVGGKLVLEVCTTCSSITW